MKRLLNTFEWKRESHFDCFKNFDNPFLNICASIKANKLLEYYKNRETLFSLSSLFLTTLTDNYIGEFKYRIENDDIVIYDRSIPWIEFTSLSHARTYNNSDLVPKIVFSKYYKINNKAMFPISVEIQYALILSIINSERIFKR